MANLQSISDISTAKIYCGTYSKYNNGSIGGEWLTLSDYSSGEEFLAACAELHKDEADPEFMFQDYENFPSEFYGESMSESDFDKLYEFITVASQLEHYSEDGWVSLHNQYCSENSLSDDEIFTFDDDFFNTYFEGRPMEAARAASFGELNWSDDYISFNGYGNLVSISKYSVSGHIDHDAIIADIIENPNNYSL